MKEDYLMDESRITGFTDEVVFPTDTKSISAYIKSAYDNKADGQQLSKLCKSSVTIQGARTGLNGGAVPFGGKTVNLENCCKVLGMRSSRENDRYYLKVQCGLTLEALNRQIRTKTFDRDLWDEESRAAYALFQKDDEYLFPTDATEQRASIGGMISCNASGACSYHYGSIRGFVEALTVVLGDGEIMHIKRGAYFAQGRKFNLAVNGKGYHFTLPDYDFAGRKNAACYYAEKDMDFMDLFIGAEGTLGIIAEAWLVLVKKPKECRGVLSFYGSYDEMKPFLHFLQSLPGNPRESNSPHLPLSGCGKGYIGAIEFFDRNALRLIKEKAYPMDRYTEIPVMKKDYFGALYYEIHGDDEEYAFRLLQDTFDKLLECTPYAQDAIAAMTDRELQRLKSFRHAAPECANIVTDGHRREDKSLTAIFTDIAMPEAEFFPMLSLYETTMQEQQIEYIIYGHIGDWHLHVNMLPATKEEYQRCMDIYQEWAQYAASRGGTISAEHGVGRLKAGMLKYMICSQDIKKCTRIKRIFDKEGIYNRGVLFEEPWEALK